MHATRGPSRGHTRVTLGPCPQLSTSGRVSSPSHDAASPSHSRASWCAFRAAATPRDRRGFRGGHPVSRFHRVLSYRSLQNRSIAGERVTHTFKVLEQAGALLSAVKDAETGQRGFLLTGEERYLEPYTKALATLGLELRDLRSLTSDNPQQLRRIDALEQTIRQKTDELEQTIALRRKGSLQDALALVHSDVGLAAMGGIRASIGELEEEERLLLIDREKQWRDTAAVSAVVTTGGSVALLVLIASCCAHDVS